MKKNKFIKILSNKNFLLIWLSQLFSLISASLLNFVLIGRIYSSTQSTVAVGFFLFFYYLPTMILGPFVGVFIDNWSKKKIFIFSNLFQSVIVLTYLGVSQKIWPIYAIVLLYSLCDEFFNPAVLASVPGIIGKNYYPLANSLLFLTTESSTILGFLAGGMMIKFLPNQNLIFGIVSFLLLLATLFSLSLPEKPFEGSKKLKLDFSDPLNLSKNLDLAEFWQQIKEGYSFIKNESKVLFPLLLLSGLQALMGMGMIVFPSLAQMIKISFADASFLLIIPTIFGALIGGALVGKKIRKIRKNVLVIGGLSSIGIICLFFSGLSLFLTPPFILVVFLTVALGISYMFIYIPLQVLIQENTPFDVRGRVFGTLSTLITLGSFFPMLITTSLVDLLGLQIVLFLFGLGILTLAFFAKKNFQLILSLGNKNG